MSLNPMRFVPHRTVLRVVTADILSVFANRGTNLGSFLPRSFHAAKLPQTQQEFLKFVFPETPFRHRPNPYNVDGRVTGFKGASFPHVLQPKAVNVDSYGPRMSRALFNTDVRLMYKVNQSAVAHQVASKMRPMGVRVELTPVADEDASTGSHNVIKRYESGVKAESEEIGVRLGVFETTIRASQPAGLFVDDIVNGIVSYIRQLSVVPDSLEKEERHSQRQSQSECVYEYYFTKGHTQN